MFLREAREAGPKTLLSCCYSRCTPIMQKSCPKSSLGPAWVVLCDGAWECALTKLLPASLHRDEHFSTKHRSSLGQRTAARVGAYAGTEPEKGCGMRASVWYGVSTNHFNHTNIQLALGERPCSIGGHTMRMMLMATIYFRSWLQIPRALGGMSLV